MVNKKFILAMAESVFKHLTNNSDAQNAADGNSS